MAEREYSIHESILKASRLIFGEDALPTYKQTDALWHLYNAGFLHGEAHAANAARWRKNEARSEARRKARTGG